MVEVTLITYLITSLLKKNSVKNDQKISLSVPKGKNYFIPVSIYSQIVGLPKTSRQIFLTK